MAINPNPTYTIEFPLSIPTWQQHRLEKKLKIARMVYNSCLGEALKRHKTVKSDKEYRKLLKEPKSKERDTQLADIRLTYGFAEYGIHRNELLALGSDIRVETMRFQSLQRRAKNTTRNKKNGKINRKKRFGKSIANRAPAMFLTIVDRKLGYQGLSLKKIDTYATKASQFNHITGECSKKQLSERWNDFGEFLIQRDLYSTFLIGNTNETLNSVDVDLCNVRWESFVTLHNREVARLKQSPIKTLRWFVA